MKVLQGLFIGPNKSLQLVKIYDRYVIIAVTKDRIELLMELSEDEIVDEQKVKQSFGDSLKKFTKTKDNNK